MWSRRIRLGHRYRDIRGPPPHHVPLTIRSEMGSSPFLIHTAELCGANPFDYLRALMAHPNEVAAHPAEWLPWNYERSTLAVAA